MRYKFIILFLLISFVGKAQVYQLMPQYGYDTKRMNFDSTIQIPTFCGVPVLGSNKINKGALAFDSCNNRFYFFNPKLQAWDTIKSADASLFVKYTDTAGMLLPYLRSIDTTNKWVNSVTKLDDSTIRVIKGTTTTDIVINYVTNSINTQRLITSVWNNSGALIPKGSVIYINGKHSSNLPTIALAKADKENTSAYTYAFVQNDIPDNSSGIVIQHGSITNLNLPTATYTDGDQLYLSPTVAGGYTLVKPMAPNHYVRLGTITRAHSTFGTIQIQIVNGFQLDELSDVSIAAVPLDSTLLQFSRVDSLWHDVSPLVAIGNRYIKPIDTVSISNRINAKLNISDTSSMLLAYMRTNTANASYVTSVFRKIASDSVFFVRGGSNNFAFRDSTGSAGWGLLGNSGTNAATNFLGTTDNVNLIFRRNNVISGRIDSTNANAGITSFGFRTTATGAGNTAFGYKTLQNATGGNNTAIGNRAGLNITSATGNTLIGSAAGASLSDASNNVAIGLSTLTSGNNWNNTAIGVVSLERTSGSNNVGIGYYSGNYNTSANNQIFINSLDRVDYTGDRTGSPFYAQQNATIASQIVTLNGRVGINTISPSASSGLEVSSTTQGFLQPRLTTTQMNAISTPATGLSVFNTTDSVEYTYRGTRYGWQKNVIYNRNNDVALFNGADQRIMIDTTTNIVAGRSLTIEAGSTIAGGTSAFQALNQTTRNWTAMCTAPNGDIYATVNNGDIYKRTGGTGNFIALSQVNRVWQGIAAASNGDIYAVVDNGDIYKQTGGTGNFIGLGQTSRQWRGIAVAPNGDIYATVTNGDIYKSISGGTFTALGQTSRAWRGIVVAANGDVIVSVLFGDIYKSTDGGGTFIALNQTSRQWAWISISSNGDIYAPVINGDIYKQTGGTGNFVGLGQTSRQWYGTTIASNGDIYAAVLAGDIYIQTQGTANLNGGTLVLQSGAGKGTGTSTINFNTGTTLSTGTTLQSASTKMTILGNGNVGIGTTSPSAILDVSSTTSAFLPPRMTTAQRDLITPVAGMIIYNSSTNKHQGYNGTTWNDFY